MSYIANFSVGTGALLYELLYKHISREGWFALFMIFQGNMEQKLRQYKSGV